MLRKINPIVLVLVLVTILNSMSIFYVHAENNVETELDGLVYALGITDKNNANKTVTRGDAAGIVLRLLGYEEVELETETIFDDVYESDKNFGAINTAYKLGIIQGNVGGTFEPKGNVTYEQFMKMLVTALGYENRAVALGGYPQGYILTASELKLDRNVKIENYEKLDVQTVSQIAENAFDVNIFTDKKNVESGMNETLLYKAFKLKKYSGIITALYGTSYTPNSYALEADDVYINDTLYKCGETDLSTLIGYNVDFYVKDNFDEPQIVVYAKKKKHNDIIINTELINNVTTDRMGMYINFYETEESKRPVTESLYYDTVSLIYNGFYTDITLEDNTLFDFSDGFVKLIDNNADGLWDFVVVERSFVTVIENYSASTNTVSFEYPIVYENKSIDKIDFQDYDTVVFEDGIKESQLTSGNVLDIYLPKTSAYTRTTIKIGLSNRTEHGELKQKISEDNKHYIQLDDETYEFDEQYLNKDISLFTSLQPGVEYTVYLTNAGKIAYIITYIEKERVYGFLTNLAVDDFGVVSVKVLMDDGKFHYLDLASRVKVYRDGVDCGKMSATNAVASLMDGSGKFDINKAQLIRFMPDKYSEISIIEFAENAIGAEAASAQYKNGAFVKSRGKYTGYYFHFPRCVYTDDQITPLFALPSKSICYQVPSNTDEYESESNFSVGSYNAGRGTVTVDTFNDNEDGLPQIFIVYKGADKYSGINLQSSLTVIKNIMKGINDRGEECEIMIDAKGNKYYAELGKNVFTDSTGAPLKAGDVIHLGKTRDGFLQFVDTLFFTDKNSSNGYGYSYVKNSDGTYSRNMINSIVAEGGCDNDRIIACGTLDSLTKSYITIKDSDETAVYGRISEEETLYTVYMNSGVVVVEKINQLNKGDYVLLKSAQSHLREVVRFVY